LEGTDEAEEWTSLGNGVLAPPLPLGAGVAFSKRDAEAKVVVLAVEVGSVALSHWNCSILLSIVVFLGFFFSLQRIQRDSQNMNSLKRAVNKETREHNRPTERL